MSKIIDHVECEVCGGEGETENAQFQGLSPEDRLAALYSGTVPDGATVDTNPMTSCPFCTDGQAPIYECDECDGEGLIESLDNGRGGPEFETCHKCEGQGWYL